MLSCKARTESFGVVRTFGVYRSTAVLIVVFFVIALVSHSQSACGPRGHGLSSPEMPDPGMRGSIQPLRAAAETQGRKIG